MWYGEHGVERRENRERRERDEERTASFALHAPTQWAMSGYVIKKRGWSDVLSSSLLLLRKRLLPPPPPRRPPPLFR